MCFPNLSVSLASRSVIKMAARSCLLKHPIFLKSRVHMLPCNTNYKILILEILINNNQEGRIPCTHQTFQNANSVPILYKDFSASTLITTPRMFLREHLLLLTSANCLVNCLPPMLDLVVG